MVYTDTGDNGKWAKIANVQMFKGTLKIQHLNQNLDYAFKHTYSNMKIGQ